MRPVFLSFSRLSLSLPLTIDSYLSTKSECPMKAQSINGYNPFHSLYLCLIINSVQIVFMQSCTSGLAFALAAY